MAASGDFLPPIQTCSSQAQIAEKVEMAGKCSIEEPEQALERSGHSTPLRNKHEQIDIGNQCAILKSPPSEVTMPSLDTETQVTESWKTPKDHDAQEQ